METLFGKIHPANTMILVWPKECKYVTKETFHLRSACECFLESFTGPDPARSCTKHWYMVRNSCFSNTEKYQHRIWFCYFLFSKSSNFGRKPTYLRQTWVFPTYSLYEVKEKRYEVIILLSLIPLLFRRVSGDCRLQQFLMHHLCYSINVVQCWKRRSCSLPIPS